MGKFNMLTGLALLAQGSSPVAGNIVLPKASNIGTIYRPDRKKFLERVHGETDENVEHWVVGLKDSTLEAKMQALLALPDVKQLTSGALKMLTFRGTLSQMELLAKTHSDTISYYEPDAEVVAIPMLEVQGVSVASNDENTPWGVARIGAREQEFTGKGVHVYVFDTGIRITHEDFGGRAIATFENQGSNKVCADDPGYTQCSVDKHGHGTHCASTATGKKYGVATDAIVHAVKILSDTGSGSLSWSVQAMSWLAEGDNAQQPAVASMSIGSRGTYQADYDGVKQLVDAGISVVVAAGNENSDACQSSPAFVKMAVTVGANDENDAMASFSNFGACIDIFAPGTSVVAASPNSDQAKKSMSGTSMACPHVSGAFALKLEQDPTLPPYAPASDYDGDASPGLLNEVRRGSDPGALQGDEKNSRNVILRVGGTYVAGCDDDSSYKDSWGFSCIWWFPFPCTFTFLLSYPEAELAEVRNFCKNSCGICQA